jgi:imidazolonepropionase-like amidohydrolase
MCYGSDLLGSLHSQQSEEFNLRAEAGCSAGDLITAATVNCAALFNMQVSLLHLLRGLGTLGALGPYRNHVAYGV